MNKILSLKYPQNLVDSCKVIYVGRLDSGQWDVDSPGTVLVETKGEKIKLSTLLTPRTKILLRPILMLPKCPSFEAANKPSQRFHNNGEGPN